MTTRQLSGFTAFTSLNSLRLFNGFRSLTTLSALASCAAALAVAPTARAQDSDGDGVPDAADNCPLIANANQSDCDSNGVGDACQSSVARSTGNMGAFGSGVTASGTLAGVGSSLWPVRLTVKAVGDLNLATEFATLRLADTVITSTLFQQGASDCPAQPDQATIVLTAAQWNALVDASTGGTMTVSIVGNTLVNASQCPGAMSEVIATFTVSPDCNQNGAFDYCDIATGTAADCNTNGLPDSCDIAAGTAYDVDADGVPDSCEADCNTNNLPDDWEITQGTAADCDLNGVPDTCDITGGAPDCNGNGVFDACDIATGSAADCNLNGVLDVCDIIGGAADCNQNGVPDACDIASGTSNDIDLDGTPDSCEADCNTNNIPDDWEIAQGTVSDCNQNGVPDTCDITAGLDRDCDANGQLDGCDIWLHGAPDDNQNCTPDVCEYARGDFGLDGSVDGKDLGYLLASWGSADPFADLDGNQLVNGADLGTLLANWGATPFGAVCAGTPAWATLLEYFPDPAVVTNPTLRAAIISSGRPWRVRDTATQMEMVLVPEGTFVMGEAGWAEPVHSVTLTQAFYMGRYEVTQGQWVAKMGSNPSYFRGYFDSASRPVETVSWDTIQDYLSTTSMRLPSEAEWEYAYRAGTTTAFHSMPGHPNGTNDASPAGTIAWYSSNSASQTHAVGGKAANALGLHDMAGNVWEWVNDWYEGYSSGSLTNPLGPVSGSYRVLRGGSWYGNTSYVRSSFRNIYTPHFTYFFIGFRVARTP
jgi:formylglycine-generating enzyme required for sulfatase activity